MLSDNNQRRPVNLLAVVVLYNCSISASTTLNAISRCHHDENLNFRLLIIDNSPLPIPATSLPSHTAYLSCPENLGLANAYNRALEYANDEGFSWLLTLDQDTSLPTTFLQQLTSSLAFIHSEPSVAVVVPTIVANGKVVSPNFFRYGAIASWFRASFTGISQAPTYAFNSAAAIRVSAAFQAGGYDPFFWLDNSDAMMFHTLSRLGKRVYIDGRNQVAHDFSMMNMNSRVSPWRYRHILLAESAFWDTHMSRLAGLERTVRLLVRSLKHILRRDQAELRNITLHFLALRLFHSRRHRIRLFREEVRRHLGKRLEATALRTRLPKVSVCMAAYNGARYITEQIASILPQLGENDELIIVDDASTDDTVSLIRAIEDPRVILLRHETNANVIATFEDAIRNATGDIIFLSDNDDIWLPGKVSKSLSAFEENPLSRVVLHAVSLIDEKGLPLDEPRWTRKGQFYSGSIRNIARNMYQGSAMAFKSTILPVILPIPTDGGFLHDVWIGVLNSLTGGRTTYIPEILLLYRRHSSNVSSKLTIVKRVGSRFWLLVELTKRLLSCIRDMCRVEAK